MNQVEGEEEEEEREREREREREKFVVDFFRLRLNFLSLDPISADNYDYDKNADSY